jgi:hypothetical protein
LNTGRICGLLHLPTIAERPAIGENDWNDSSLQP